MAFKYKVEGAEEAWEREFGERARRRAKRQGEEQPETEFPFEVPMFAALQGVTGGPDRTRGLGIWCDANVDTGDYVSASWISKNDAVKEKTALVQTYCFEGIPLGLYLGGKFVAFERLVSLEVVKPRGTFYLEEMSEEARKGYRTWIERVHHVTEKIPVDSGS